MKDIKIVIPCRYGSSRLHGKPLLEIDGFPLFWHVYQRCIEANAQSRNIFIATDNEDILTKAENLGLNVIMTSVSHESGTDRINEVALQLNWLPDDIVVNVQGDEPLIPAELISSVSQFAKYNSDVAITTAITSVCSYDDFINPNVVKVIIGEDSRALYFTRSPSPLNRDNPKHYEHAVRHIGIYAYRVRALNKFCSYPESELEKLEKLEQLRALSNGMSIAAVTYVGEIPHGVDTQEDLEFVRLRMEQLNECY
ncbi:3-deoxy-manno-octulosonate cytidylyltransferase [Enterovibrio norvegicus]|uniref:3-deoxy-manno-octulosonate cytidylyltransferase n=1 Tax=Enterovibrio norvegicus TaxID=188144 RepID=UPI0010BF61E0|nr:3-deoxy-manno-octulosonate cytidylyltransferase [Enterovibrio norvegicus]TKF30072.1 3-deoxy-manno-octulosonate cytidylyltransferase [Enterovibrio norvegicus]